MNHMAMPPTPTSNDPSGATDSIPMPPGGTQPPPEDMSPEEDMGESQPESQVICTVCYNPADGTFTLYHGDEPEETADAEEAGEEEGGQVTEEGGEAGAEGDQEGPQAEHYDSVGELMRAVLECVRHAEEGGQGGEDQFAAGYKEG